MASYRIELTPLEFRTLDQIGNSYNYARVLSDALEEGPDSADEDLMEDMEVFYLPEHAAWEWMEALEEEDGWMPLAGGTLAEKLMELYEEIV